MTEVTKAEFTQEEKGALIEDITNIGNLIASHDNSIFQLIAAINVVQRTLVEKGVSTNDELRAGIKAEIEKMQAIYIEELQKAQAAQTKEEA